MNIRLLLTLLISLLLFACARENKESTLLNAQEIVDASIMAHGGAAYDKLNLTYTFRKKDYSIQKGEEGITYTRTTYRDSMTVLDRLENGNFSRSINGQAIQVVDSMAQKYSNSVNSVNYFVQLPSLLNDGSVQKKLLGKTQVKGQKYYKIQVNFTEEGGGEDFEDTYIYWFRTDNFIMDYLAYDYKTDGGGVRFREAYNPREASGIRIQDYVNYKADHTRFKVQEMDKLFEEGKLEELSKIETILK
ncbi:MAG: DUF6503 family protein [Bacteroidota bacterium]